MARSSPGAPWYQREASSAAITSPTAAQVGGNGFIAGRQVGCGHDRPDLLQRHVKARKRRMTWALGDLLSRVAPVPGARVDVSRFEEADLVVVAQRLDAEMGGPGEVADGER